MQKHDSMGPLAGCCETKNEHLFQKAYNRSVRYIYKSCADPDNFVRGGPTLTFFFFFELMRGGRMQIPL